MDTTRISLLIRIRDRCDDEAWEVFDALYRPMLVRFALAMGVPADEADEIAQQCLATVADKIDRFEYDPGRGKFKSWLATIVKNRVRNYWRDRRDRQAESHLFEQAAADEPTPDEVFERMWMEEHLWRCIRDLRVEVEERTFRAFQLYVLEQRPIDQVCSELGLSRNNVYTIKWRMTERISQSMRMLLGEAS